MPPDGVDEAGPLYLTAIELEKDEALAAEMGGWELALGDDGAVAPNGEAKD